MIDSFDKFINEEAKIDVESDNTMELDFTLVPVKTNVAVESVTGRFEDEILDLTFKLTDGSEIEFDGRFFSGPPKEYHVAKGHKEYIKVTRTFGSPKTTITYDIDPVYYTEELLFNWGDDTFAIMIHGLFYDDMKLQGFKSMPKLNWAKIKKL